MAYRPIQPLVPNLPRADSLSAAGTPDQNDQGHSVKRPRGSTRQVAQACPHCRLSKAKCDGARPRCGNCVARNKPCSYIGEAGQSRQAAMMNRLETLETLFKTLQTQPSGTAEKLFHRIRGADDAISLSRLVEDAGISDADSELSKTTHSTSRTSAQVETDLSSVSVPQSPFFSSKYIAMDGDSPRDSTDQHDAVVAEITLPERPLIERATKAFFSSSLQPFHVISREEVARLIRLVYSETSPLQQSGHAALACVAAVAAVGARYPQANIDTEATQALYDLARYHFEAVIEANPLDSIKCCVLLAMYNFMARSTVALVYVETGLSMARRQGLYARDPRDTTLTVRRWTEYRKAWRTLLCLSSWIPFTSGFNEDHDDPSFRIPLIDMDIGPQTDDADILQCEMTKISLLKADLLRARLAGPNIDVATMQSANLDLQNWYSQRPEIMLLQHFAQPSQDEGVQTCICFIHLLHLDTNVLLARRAMSQFVRGHGFGNRDAVPWTEVDRALVNQVALGVLAASHASRLLALLRGAGQVQDVSWLIMNQAHSACMILLHSTAQKQLHQLPKPQWQESLKQAETCLSILKACGHVDPLATQLYNQLNAIHGAILSQPPSASPTLCPLGPSIEQIPDEYLLTVPPDADPGVVELSARLLGLLSQAFDDMAEKRSKIDGAPDANDLWKMNLEESRLESPRVGFGSGMSGGNQGRTSVQRLADWNFESTLPFRVDPRRSGRILTVDSLPRVEVEESEPSPTWVEGGDVAKRRKASTS